MRVLDFSLCSGRPRHHKDYADAANSRDWSWRLHDLFRPLECSPRIADPSDAVMNASRIEKLRRSLGKAALWIGAFSTTIFLLDYSLDISKRVAREPACIWDLVENPRHISYVARWCKLTKDTTLLRLYDPKEETLLAERMFFELDASLFWWTVDELGYDIQREYVIKLPPTWIDRFRTKLP